MNWSKSVVEIDTQFADKFKLADKQIAFIELMIKPM